jgi:hypothetical protein
MQSLAMHQEGTHWALVVRGGRWRVHRFCHRPTPHRAAVVSYAADTGPRLRSHAAMVLGARIEVV